MTIQQLFQKLDKEKVLNAFVSYWESIYADPEQEGKLIREFPVLLKPQLSKSIDIIRMLECTPEDEKYKLAMERVIDDEDKTISYLHISAFREDGDIAYAITGTDWKTQLLWEVSDDYKNFGIPEELYAAMILFELTFFGCTPEAIKEKMDKWDSISAEIDELGPEKN